ncbi:MAG: hypothetical protein LRZ94_01035 [Candidatus Pacebacteria bacterium]|nr:hypothetical protein [Candidatus Paceibacterota bacterium]
MNWINFLHIYQPSDQTRNILERVVNESYRPIFRGLLDIEKIKININISGALTELLSKNGYSDVLDDIKKLAEDGKLEFVESAKYHSLLPFLKEGEIIRQVEKNKKTNKKYFGKVYNPACFFPPEMAYSQKVAKAIYKMGYKMILVDEISYNSGKTLPPSDKLFVVEDTNLPIVFRERRVSNCIMSATVRNRADFFNLIKNEDKNNYLCTAMDGETFGHHRPGLEKTLFKIMESTSGNHIFFSELLNLFEISGKINPTPSTWATTVEDIDKGVQFYSWKDPKNKVHQIQWEFVGYLSELIKKKKISNSLLEKIDQAMASDQFFWASGEPWWSIEMIEKGAWAILQVLKLIPEITKKELEKGERYYKDILYTSFYWQRSGRIEGLSLKYKESTKIPFKERTLEDGKPEVYYAFIDMMKKKMKKATSEKNYERAILWRDAIWKLETKNDIYDAIHAVDLLRMEVADPELVKLMDKYKKRYEKLRPGQPEQRKA